MRSDLSVCTFGNSAYFLGQRGEFMILDVIQVSKDLFSASFTIERENTQIGRHLSHHLWRRGDFSPKSVKGRGG